MRKVEEWASVLRDLKYYVMGNYPFGRSDRNPGAKSGALSYRTGWDRVLESEEVEK